MEDLDLNINNYDYNDLLNLFNIPNNFGEMDMKRAKRHVLAMHPDKSNLDKKYFLFFSAAYKIVYSIYTIREKATITDKLQPNNEKLEYLAEEDRGNREILESLKKNDKMQPEEFNKWFNKLFEEVKLENEYESGGYGEWLKNETADMPEQECKNLASMNKIIDARKASLRTTNLSKYNGIRDFNDNNYCDLTNNKPESYSSEMFSNLQYEDLRRAHEESVVPVTSQDFKQREQTVEEIRINRQQQDLGPLSEQAAKKYLETNKYNENTVSAQRAFKLAKQEEEARIANDKFWSSLKTLQ